MMFNALTAVKFAVSGLVGLGTGKIVSGIVKDHVKPETLIDKVSIAAATWTLSGIVTSASKKYTGEMIDEIYNGVNEAVTGIKLRNKLARINANLSSFADEGLDQTKFHRKDDQKWYPNDETVVTTEEPAAE